MQTFFKSILFFSFLILGIQLINTDHVNALSVDNSCTKVETIFARGSGQKVNDDKSEGLHYFSQIGFRLPLDKISLGTYDLGTEAYGGNQYPAVATNNWGYTNTIGAVISSGQAFAYGDSVKQGIGELQSYLTQRYNKCKSTGTLYVLGGYSQGAQVVGQALPGIAKEIRDKIVFVGLFGDPKLHYPEGEGWNPPACQGKDLSLWRRAASNCDLDSGSLGARKPYLPDDMKAKTGLWCYAKDTVCDLGALGEMSGHSEYKDEGRAIDAAAREAAMKLTAALNSTGIDTSQPRGSGTTGIDTVFVIDTTGSMGGIIDQTKAFARDSADKIKAQNGRVALVAYRDAGDIYTAKILSGFDDDYSLFQSQLNSLTADGGGDIPEATLHALMTAMNGLSWKNGATKAAVVLTDAGFHSPDLVDGSTIASVAKRSLEIDPVNIYPVVSNGLATLYQELATTTSGQVIDNTGDTVAALTTALTKIQERPVPLLKNLEYKAEPGQEVTFDASDSYVIDASITKYEWDFNGDGVFEATTTTRIINYIYSAPFSGTMQVRLTASNSTVANTSASMTISTAPPPAPPATPSNLTATINNTSGDKSTVTINWQSATIPSKWLIKMNDLPMGYIPGDRTSLQITDVDRSEDVIISVAGATSDLQTGEYANTTIAALEGTPEPLIISTCSQSNIFLRIICKAISFFVMLIQGIVHYILPWRI